MEIKLEDLPKLPPPLDVFNESPITPLTADQKAKWECSLDGVSAITLPKPANKEEEEKLVAAFLRGLEKLLSKGEQLGLSAAVVIVSGILRKMPDLCQRMPHVRV